jgi:alkylhydroperoxidase family enzyme
MRLEPVNRPPTWKARLAAWSMRRRLGKVMTPARVVYDRVPRMYDVGWALLKVQERGLVLDAGTRHLVTTWVAMLNRCAFCVDIGRAFAVLSRLGLGKLDALPDWRSSPLFDERERAALAYVEEATRERRVSDETFERLRKHFSEREIVEITLLNAIENFYNLVNLPLEIESDELCRIAQLRVGGGQPARAPLRPGADSSI